MSNLIELERALREAIGTEDWPLLMTLVTRHIPLVRVSRLLQIEHSRLSLIRSGKKFPTQKQACALIDLRDRLQNAGLL
jgi:hypothetical protein